MTYAYGKNILPMTVGFDRLFSTMEELDKVFGATKAPSYPPYSIIKLDDYNYEIQIAVAGFSKEEISITVKGDELIVVGVKTTGDGPDTEYIHRGLAFRDFERYFRLEGYLEVADAEIKDGLLIIKIKRNVPEEKKPKQIEIK